MHVCSDVLLHMRYWINTRCTCVQTYCYIWGTGSIHDARVFRRTATYEVLDQYTMHVCSDVPLHMRYWINTRCTCVQTYCYIWGTGSIHDARVFRRTATYEVLDQYTMHVCSDIPLHMRYWINTRCTCVQTYCYIWGTGSIHDARVFRHTATYEVLDQYTMHVCSDVPLHMRYWINTRCTCVQTYCYIWGTGSIHDACVFRHTDAYDEVEINQRTTTKYQWECDSLIDSSR